MDFLSLYKNLNLKEQYKRRKLQKKEDSLRDSFNSVAELDPEDEINTVNLYSGFYYLTEESKQSLFDFKSARSGRKMYKIESMGIGSMYEHFCYLENLKKNSFVKFYLINIRESVDRSEYLAAINNVRKKIEYQYAYIDKEEINNYSPKIIEQLEQAKKHIPENKEWCLVYVDREHIDQFNEYMSKYDSFITKEIMDLA